MITTRARGRILAQQEETRSYDLLTRKGAVVNNPVRLRWRLRSGLVLRYESAVEQAFTTGDGQAAAR